MIGAGSSGLVAARLLQERGIPFEAFEIGSDVGGLWRYENDSGRSPAYASLTANTSRERTAYTRLPMPKEWPDYPRHEQILAYLETFVERFGLRERIEFRTEVVRVVAAGGSGAEVGAYHVTVRNRDTGAVRSGLYRAVLVASGHHWDPRLPELPGSFDGLQLHSFAYRTPDLLVGRRVLVVGIGNSACDIACEAATVAARMWLSTRRGAHVLPKHLLGRPLDQWLGPASSRLPTAAQRRLFQLLVWLDRGSQRRYGVPTPPYPLGSEHPTISSDLLIHVREGRIGMKPPIERLEGDRVRFTDGSTERVDVILYATGYRVSFPFLEPGLVEVEENRVPLYLHVVPPERPGLYFVGLVQPLGAIMPLAEAQAEWIADLLEGRACLPDPEEMQRRIRRDERRLWRRFVRSPRHTMEVDVFPYLREVARERRRGRRRMRRRRAPGGRAPVDRAASTPVARSSPPAPR